jgi:hypothetical protein
MAFDHNDDWNSGTKTDKAKAFIPAELPNGEKPAGAKKLDDGKLPVMRGVFARFPMAMVEIARVSQAGTTKYGVPITDMEYKNVPDGQGRYEDALGRHSLQHITEGPVNIEKGGQLPPEGVALFHLAQRAWDALASFEIFLEGLKKAGQPITPAEYLETVQKWERFRTSK